MTKTLTEQWREGTLPRGGYYIKLLDGSTKQTNYDNISKTIDTEYFRYNVSVKEVLAPVPGYDEYKRLVSNSDESSRKALQLEIATKALSDIEDGYSKATGAGQIVRQALKEMEGVK